MIRIIVQDALNDVFIQHQEKNASVEEVEQNIAKCCGINLQEVVWKSENKVSSPKGTCTVKIGELEYKQIIIINN